MKIQTKLSFEFTYRTADSKKDLEHFNWVVYNLHGNCYSLGVIGELFMCQLSSWGAEYNLIIIKLLITLIASI